MQAQAVLSMPTGEVIAPEADEYEIILPGCSLKVQKRGNDLVLSFDADDRVVLRDFISRKTQAGRWTRVPGQKCLYSRLVNGVACYQIQAMSRGRRYTDTLGPVSLDCAIRIRDELAANRKGNCGPQSYREILAEPAPPAERNWTFEGFRNEVYLPHRARLDRSQMDAQLMESRWKNHITSHFGNKQIKKAAEKDFEAFAAEMKGKAGPTTILHCLSDLRRLWSHARKTRAVDRPFPGSEAIQEIRRSHDNEKKCWLTPEEAALLVNTARKRRLKSRTDHDVYCYIVLGLALGLRAGEIHKLNRQAIERHLIEGTKNKRSRFAHFGFGPVAAMLEERVRIYPPGDPFEPLFPSCKGTPRKTVPKKYYKLIKELGFNDTPRRKGHHLERIDFHALRHTFATLAAMRGVDHLTLMRLMGHRTPGMTLRYIEIADSHQATCQEIAMKDVFNELAETAKLA